MNAIVQDLKRAADSMPAVRLVRGDAVTLEPVRWAWPGYLPRGMLTILGGAPGSGKTTIALSLTATMTRAGTRPDASRCTTAGDALIWSGEDAHPVIAARLAAAGADMSRVHFVDGVTGGYADGTFDPGRDMLLLEAAAEKLPNLQLLILDPIVSAVAGDSHKNAEVRRSLQPVV
ncbi:MAG: AAA family ATPase, partial [Rubrivivax sp.]|nr:AAA family ATPase [Rubrivivax sp.]